MISNSKNFQNIDRLDSKQKKVAYNIGVNSNAKRMQEKQDDDELQNAEEELQKDEEVAQKADEDAAKEKQKEEVETSKNEILKQDQEYANKKIQNKVNSELEKEKEKTTVNAEKAKIDGPPEPTQKKKEKLTESEVLENLDKLNSMLESK